MLLLEVLVCRIMAAMLLIFPPVAKPCEPPAGIALLASRLRSSGIQCRLLDANLEGLLWLHERPLTATDTWTRRAARNRRINIASLRDIRTYQSPGRYSKSVGEVNRLLSMAGSESNVAVGLADYQHPALSPLRSRDLIAAAESHDQNPFFPWFSSRLPELLDGVQTVGISLNYLSQALCSFAIIGYLRKRFPSHRIIVGGGLVTSWMQRPGWHNPFGSLVDSLVAGPGEFPLLALSGIAVPEKRHVLPDYSGLPLPDYLSPGFILPYSASSGCYWNHCNFCPEQAEGNRYLPVPAGVAIADLHLLTEQTRPVLIHLLDNAVSPAMLQGLAINPPGAPWYGFARIDNNLADPEFCHSLRRSGCTMLKLGLESGDQGVLDRMNKGIDLGTASRVIENLRQAGIAVYLYLLFGTPGETVVEARRTLDFVVRHRDAIAFLNVAVFNMPLCSTEAAEYGTEPFYEGDLSLYTAFRHPRNWNRQRVRSFLGKEFSREPSVAAILRNDPRLFTSNHAPFFVA